MPEVRGVFAPKMILCPLDLSAASRTVLNWAGMFAEVYHAKLELLHAAWSEYPPYFLPSQAEELEGTVQQQRAVLTDSLAKLARETLNTKFATEIAVVEGHPVEKILEHAASRKPELIVMGSHGRSGITRLRLGSVAENVVRSSLTPTLVVRSREAEQMTARISRILCPINFTDAARGCLRTSAEIARSFGAQFVIMHAVEGENANLKSTREQLCQWVPSEVRSRCDLVEVVRQGNAAEQILRVAREHAVDLIALGAQHHRLFEFTMLGSTTERVVRHADSAVLVIPETSTGAK
jgi:nucleotide-binding universal stress UspA family protein